MFGAGGHARVVADALRLAGWDIAGFVDDVRPARHGETFAGSVVLGRRADALSLRDDGVLQAVVAIGRNDARLHLADELAAAGFSFPPVVHPRAIVSPDAKLGLGVFVGPGAIVNPAAHIGAQAIVNSGAIVEHDCVVGDGAHVAPRACMAGRASLGRAATLGAGAVVRDGVSVGAGTTVGMGSVVVKDLPAGVTAWGCPARVRSTRSP